MLFILFYVTTLVPSIRRMKVMINILLLLSCLFVKIVIYWIDNETLHTNLISIKVMNVARVVGFFPWNICKKIDVPYMKR